MHTAHTLSNGIGPCDICRKLSASLYSLFVRSEWRLVSATANADIRMGCVTRNSCIREQGRGRTASPSSRSYTRAGDTSIDISVI